jgi:hypothetical protein
MLEISRHTDRDLCESQHSVCIFSWISLRDVCGVCGAGGETSKTSTGLYIKKYDTVIPEEVCSCYLQICSGHFTQIEVKCLILHKRVE